MKEIEIDIETRKEITIDESMFDKDLTFNEYMLAQVIFVAGHLAVKMLVYIESIDKLLEKKHKARKLEQQAKSNGNEQEEELNQISDTVDAELERDKEFF